MAVLCASWMSMCGLVASRGRAMLCVRVRVVVVAVATVMMVIGCVRGRDAAPDGRWALPAQQGGDERPGHANRGCLRLA